MKSSDIHHIKNEKTECDIAHKMKGMCFAVSKLRLMSE
jgi:hypothetical protein